MYSEYVLLPCLPSSLPAFFSSSKQPSEHCELERCALFLYLSALGAQTSRNIQPGFQETPPPFWPPRTLLGLPSLVQRPVLSHSPQVGKLIVMMTPCVPISWDSLHSVLNQQNQHHKWMKWISVEFEASCHGSWEDYFWTGPLWVSSQNVLHRQLPVPSTQLSHMFQVVNEAKKEKLVLLREWVIILLNKYLAFLFPG